jgi:hypothetical protein
LWPAPTFSSSPSKRGIRRFTKSPIAFILDASINGLRSTSLKKLEKREARNQIWNMIKIDQNQAKYFGLLAQLEAKSTDAFGTVLECLEKNEAPLPALASIISKKLGFNEDSVEYKAIQKSAVIASNSASKVAYHNIDHFRNVGLTFVRLALNETPKIPARKIAVGFMAALGHDAGHPGGSNKKPAEFEKIACEMMEPVKAMLTPTDRQLIDEMILATEFPSKAIETRKEYLEHKGNKHIDPILQLKALLSDSDLNSSVGISSHIMIKNSINVQKEAGIKLGLKEMYGFAKGFPPVTTGSDRSGHTQENSHIVESLRMAVLKQEKEKAKETAGPVMA